MLGAVTLLLISGSFWLYARMNVGLAFEAATTAGRGGILMPPSSPVCSRIAGIEVIVASSRRSWIPGVRRGWSFRSSMVPPRPRAPDPLIGGGRTADQGEEGAPSRMSPAPALVRIER